MEFSKVDINNLTTVEKGSFIRNQINKEYLLTLDFKYLTDFIESWWKRKSKVTNYHLLKVQLQNLLLDNINEEDFYYFDKIGLSGHCISAICIKNIFATKSKKLTLLVHEALSELLYLQDLKYQYEDHKLLYLKLNGIYHEEWGNGIGKISPHADDLYENIDTDFVSLTVCKDLLKKSTLCYLGKHFLDILTDEELGKLTTTKAKFISGKNVNGLLIERIRNVCEINTRFGITFNFDFRIEPDKGNRMLPIEKDGEILLSKIRDHLEKCYYHTLKSDTGNFFMLANHKVLHGRDSMQLSNEMFSNIFHQQILEATPRLLYRSKGPRVTTYFNMIQ